MPTLRYAPSIYDAHSYHTKPELRAAAQAISVICAYRDLAAVARAALLRQGYGETNGGLGIEYPTRPDRAGQVRIWYWERRPRRGPHPTDPYPFKIVTRKFHIAERIYLAALAGVLEAHALPQAAEVRALRPLEPLAVRFAPSIFADRHYQIEPFSYDAQRCLIAALAPHDLARSRALALAGQGFRWFEQRHVPAPAEAPLAHQLRELRYTPAGMELHGFDLAGRPTAQPLDRALYEDLLGQLLAIHGLPGL